MFLRRCGEDGMKVAQGLSKSGWNAGCGVVGINERPET
jgi:hypothetical protein